MVWSMSAACVLTFGHRHAPVGLCTILRPRRRSVADRRRCAARTSLPQLAEGDLRVRHGHDRWNLTLSPPYRTAPQPRRFPERGARRRPSGCRRPRCAARSGPLAEVGSGEEVAHYRDRRRSLAIAFRDLPAPQDRNPHGREEPRPRLQDAVPSARRPDRIG